jgi:hypothetical protein
MWVIHVCRATPLHALASWGAVGFARAQVLIENHALDAHFSNKEGVANAVAELVKYGGKSVLNAKDSVMSRSALHVAALSDNDAFIQAAFSQGANIDQVDYLAAQFIYLGVFGCNFGVALHVSHFAISWILGCGRRFTPLQQVVA